MKTRTEERVDDWSTRPTTTGYDGLRDLADDGFSGAVRARGTWLFMLNGRIVGVFEGEIEDFESASATPYKAPDPSLPLLFTMLEKGGEQQAKYYTEDTPVAEADGTLSSGSFTGYIELSENVLSGDYYVVYYGGRSMKCAFVGNSEDLLTGDEAFERANDEVGIYEVRNVDIEVTDVPSASGTTGDAHGDADGVGSTDSDSNAEPETGTGVGTGTTAENSTAGTGVTDEAGGVGVTDDIDAGSGTGGSPTVDDAATTGTSDARQSGSERSSGGETPPTDAATDRQSDVSPDTTATERTETSTGESGATEVGDVTPSPEDDVTTSPERDDAARTDGSTADQAPTESVTDSVSHEDAPDPMPSEETTRESPSGSEPDLDPTHPTERESFGTAAGDATDPTDADPAVETEPEPDSDTASASTEPPETPANADDSGADRTDTAGPGQRADDGPKQESWDTDLGSDDAPSAEAERTKPGNEDEAEWRETQTIPALDPDRTSTGDDGGRSDSQAQSSARGTGTRGASGRQAGNRGGPTNRDRAGSQGQTADRDRAKARGTGDNGSSTQRSTENSEALKQEVLEREDKIDQLQQRVSDLQGERDRLRSERDDLAGKNESLRGEVEELESEIERLEQTVSRLKTEVEDARQAAGDTPNASQRISPAEALQGTNLFVRYGSKGDATLDDARAGEADAEAVNANLRLEHHTQFETDDVAVDGQAFDEFLTNTLEFNFVDWIVGGLLYEIRDTGHATALEDLYNAIPEIDRAEIKGNVSLVYTENGDEVREQQQFDIVLRDRMGNPLVVADLNDSRQPVTQDGMAGLQNSASKVKETNDRLCSAFVVTSSFFEPGALETAAEATSGSFLSRDSKESFVKLARKKGYHLCLVESRGRDFHLNVPEL
ncbi:hypothetical protein [Halostella sp. PRR32]|uniref:DUF7527 domain-containing protein n=1 Tax=Halostella sp. PRR32 TaxID=3098147 RepID=UPI002B1E63D8|nr:hypothetical protein [Halostella sp. PRR32]